MPRTVRVNFSVEPEIERELRARADREGRSLSNFLRRECRNIAFGSQDVKVSTDRMPGRIADATRRIAKNYTG